MHSCNALLLFFLFVGAYSESYMCLDGWTLYLQSDKCVKASDERKSFLGAEEVCKTAADGYGGGSLVSIHSAFQNAQLGGLATKVDAACNYWTGLIDLDDSGNKKWIDGTGVDYTSWAPGFPTGKNSTGVYMNLSSRNQWEDTVEIYMGRCFLCEMNAIRLPTSTAVPTTTIDDSKYCEAGWKYYNANCYYYYDREMNETDAENACVAIGSHLVSLHSPEEVDFLRWRFPHEPYWIGLYYYGNTWLWTDGSAVDYEYWSDLEPYWPEENPCVIAEYAEQIVGAWINVYCENTSVFVCKKKSFA